MRLVAGISLVVIVSYSLVVIVKYFRGKSILYDQVFHDYNWKQNEENKS
jgi:hypothetical protein